MSIPRYTVTGDGLQDDPHGFLARWYDVEQLQAEVERLTALLKECDDERLALKSRYPSLTAERDRLAEDPRLSLTVNELRHGLESVRAWRRREPESAAYADQMEERLLAAHAALEEAKDTAQRQMTGLMASWEREQALRAELAETIRVLDEALATIKSTPTMDEMIKRMHEVQDAWKAKYAALKASVPDPDDLRDVCELAELHDNDFGLEHAITRLRATIPKEDDDA